MSYGQKPPESVIHKKLSTWESIHEMNEVLLFISLPVNALDAIRVDGDKADANRKI